MNILRNYGSGTTCRVFVILLCVTRFSLAHYVDEFYDDDSHERRVLQIALPVVSFAIAFCIIILVMCCVNRRRVRSRQHPAYPVPDQTQPCQPDPPISCPDDAPPPYPTVPISEPPPYPIYPKMPVPE
ncbi:hypothetical protein CSKR_109807 [Clonorchis sinensis]|uniref:Uncharacterized protein n=2 Tax=Clonorchis sinensis TaxID=79923 RepID=G7YDX8_CLOSI|nr:hypothetical protein CSKR_109807 [Clonorchis sinensis]GAA51162.1 hypothetical protein CLF_105662 [Clonorchis sinensis]